MKQKIITIGLIQTKVAQDRQANLEKTVKMIACAAKKGAQRGRALQQIRSQDTVFVQLHPAVKMDH